MKIHMNCYSQAIGRYSRCATIGNTDEDALAISGYKIKMKILRRNIYMNGHYKNKDSCIDGVPQSRMKTEDAENTVICLNH